MLCAVSGSPAVAALLPWLSWLLMWNMLCRYGLNSEGRIVSRSEICKAYNCSEFAVASTESAALAKMLKPWRQKVLKTCHNDYVDLWSKPVKELPS
jgi:hypothetical protein